MYGENNDDNIDKNYFNQVEDNYLMEFLNSDIK